MRYRDEIKRKVVVSFKTNHFDGEDSLDSYFASAVEKWTNSSSSEQFIAFRRKIAPYVLSLKLIIFHQDLICQELKTFWEQLGDTCLPPALDHIRCFLPLLSHCSSDIPRFTAECLAFLFRKFVDKIALFHTLEEMIENPECLGAVLVEMLSGVGEKVHTTSLEILPCLLDSLFSLSCDSKQSVQLDCDSHKNENNPPDVSNASMKMTRPVDDCCSVSKSVIAVSYSLSQLVKRSPSSEQINYVIQHLTRQCQRLSSSPNPQHFREYLTLLTSFIQSLAKSEFMSLFEENISKILITLNNCYSSPDVLNLCCVFLQSVSTRYNPYDFVKSVSSDSLFKLESKLGNSV
ncbi:uncharacterized protein DC041_0011548 [Schistosoma bovis]|uniref:Uncharacterized protein n=1 Tax=Schistosoma bovis TaxID=6184 RepID=A0A430QI07_SCHBO|nr:uncharacterized protein DC041_0011548 [Schistosoma bovis]